MQKIKKRGGKVEFDYFYNRDGDRFSYYMLPKIIVKDERFKNLSSDAKILYSCLLERISLSFRNKWLDEGNRVYIIFTVEEIMEILGRSNKTAARILNELDSTSGSGNFLTETYISLRKLENRILDELQDNMMFEDMGNIIKVSIQQFYGIEINDFAVKVAKTVLWI